MKDWANIAISLGSLYLDGEAVRDPMYSSGCTITLGDSTPYKTLSWLRFGRKLVSAMGVCRGLKWKDLDDAGFIDGAQVTLDGWEFQCHIPHVYRDDSEPLTGIRPARLWEGRPPEDETELLLERVNAVGTSSHIGFWVKVLGKKGMDCRDTCWGTATCPVGFHGHFFPKAHMAWLPILEPMNQADPEENLGKEMSLLVSGHALKCVPLEASSYDLVVRVPKTSLTKLHSEDAEGSGVWWAPVSGNVVALDKTRIIHSRLEVVQGEKF